MLNLKKTAVWFMMLAKRLLFRRSFVALLLAIPFLVPILSAAVSGRSSVMTIALCNENENSAVASAIIRDLTEEKTVINYICYPDIEKARNAVVKGEADCAWIFESDFEELMKSYVKKESKKPFVRIIAGEETISQNLAREKLFGKIFSYMSYEIYRDFVSDKVLSGKPVGESEYRRYFDMYTIDSSLIQVQMINSGKKVNTGINYLKSPLRGLLALMVMLCGFSAVLLFMKENSSGVYNRMSFSGRMIPAFGTCFSAILISAAVMLISLYTGGLAASYVYECIAIIAYAFAATGFCLMICALIKRYEFFGPLVPFLMLTMLAVCPVFFSFRLPEAIKLIFPPYYYLMAQSGIEYVIMMVVYSAITITASFVISKIRS